MGICTKIAAGWRRCAAAAIALCLVAMLSVAAAAPASAISGVITLKPSTVGYCSTNSSCDLVSNEQQPPEWGRDGNNAYQAFWVQGDNWIISSSRYSGSVYFAYVYDIGTGLATSTSNINFYVSTATYLYRRASAESSPWNLYRITLNNVFYSSSLGRIYAVYNMPSWSDTAYFLSAPENRPTLILDFGDDMEVSAPELEAKVEENTDAVQQVDESINDLKDSILSTEGSDSVVSGVLGDDEESWLCSRLGFLCTVANIPVTMLETIFVIPASDSWDFPGITLPGFDLEIPAQEVSLWTFIPDDTQTLIKGGATFIVILLWVKGMFSLYRRFIGEEQTVQIEGSD